MRAHFSNGDEVNLLMQRLGPPLQRRTCLSLQLRWKAADGKGEKKHQRRAVTQGIKDVTQASEI